MLKYLANRNVRHIFVQNLKTNSYGNKNVENRRVL
jgi:hypothetical protein